jgi:MSHA biogenesis protein MshQ
MLGVFSLFWPCVIYAATCAAMFPDGLQSHKGGTGSITLNSGAVVNNSGSVLTAPSLTNNAGVGSCGTGVTCGVSNTASLNQTIAISGGTGANGTINVATGSPSYAAGNYTTVAISNASPTFSTSGGNYYFNGDWTVGDNSIITLAPGNYYISGNIYFNGTGSKQIKIGSAGTVKIYVSGQIVLGGTVTTPSVSSRYLLIYANGSIDVNGASSIHAFLYSNSGTVTLNSTAVVYGAISGDYVTLNGAQTVYYEATEASNASFGSFCTASAASLNNFLIDVGGGTGSNCAASTINITARDSSNATLTSYAGTVTISTSTANGSWAKTATAADAYGTLTAGAADSGAATYVFNASDAGTISINLTDTHAESLTISLNDSSAGVTSTSSALVFSRNAFVVTSTDTLASDIIAGRTHSLRVTMMKQNTTGTSCSAASDYNVSGLKAWLTRASGDPAGTAPNLINSSSASVALPNAKPGSNNVTLNFASGIANFTLSNSDVGKYSINFADGSTSYSASEILGSSSTYVVRPFGFHISVTSNPAASSDTGSVFTTAGTNFTVNVTAKAYSATDDANSDGVPDNHADTNAANNANLADNSTLVKFGAESPAETITLTSALRLPSGGIDPGLSDGDATANDGRIISSFTSGVGSTTQAYFSEVGIIELAATITDGDYLGTGTTPTTNMVSRSGYVGRFKPYQFAASSVSLTPFCNVSTAFNYLSKDFSAGLTLAAQNQQAGTTQNYTGVFAKLTSAGYTFKARDTTSATNLTSRMQLSSLTGSWASGQIAASANINLARTTSPDGPYTTTRVGVTLSDTDSVSLRSADITFDSDANGSNDALLFGQTAFYYGRLRLDDAHGPETANLNVSFQTDYWAGSIWTRNRADSCTTIATSAVSYPSGAINVVGNRTVTVGTGSTTGTYTSLAGNAVNFSSGDAGHYFSTPGSGKTGSFLVDVDLTNYAWLRFDWNNDANYSNDTALPSARYTFGNYRGNDRMIFWQDTSVP